MTAVLLLLFLQGSPDYYLDQRKISRNDILDTGGRIYVRAKSLEEPLRLIWRKTLGGGEVGVYRDKFGGGVFPLGNGKDAVVHSTDLYFSLTALERKLGVTVEEGGGKITLRSDGKKASPPKRTGLVPGDRMVDLALPLLKNPKRVEPLTRKRKGKRILLFFWAPWDRSREGLSAWQDLYRRLRRYDMVVIGIALDAAGTERSGERLGRVTMPVYFDRNWKSARTLGIGVLPSWVLVDEWGFVRGTGRESGEAEVAFKRLEKPRGRGIKAWIPDGDLEPLPGSRWEAISSAAALWGNGKEAEGVDVLSRHLKTHEEDRLLRRQKWSVQFPGRMHGKALDPEWLEAQEKRERTGG